MSVKPPPFLFHPATKPSAHVMHSSARRPEPARPPKAPPPRVARLLVKPRKRLLDRILDLVLADWWIDVLLMLFIVGSMLFLHQ